MQKLLDNELYNVRLYNNRLVAHQMDQLGLDAQQTAEEAKVSVGSVHSCVKGTLGTLKTLRQIADALHIKWEFMTRIDLPRSQFHRAVVRTGNLASGVVKKGG